MAKRMILMLLTVVLFLVTIGSVKYLQVQAAVTQASSFRPPPEAVTTILATQEQWQATLGAIGSVSAVQGVTVSADLPGMIGRIAFDSGEAVRSGDLLVQLDTSQERAQQTAARARRDLASANLERMRGLLRKGVSSQAEYDAAEANHKQAAATVEEIHAAIERKTIRAPFAGILGIRQVNLGQYLRSGDPVVPLQSLDPLHVNFTVPQQQVGRMQVGGEVRVTVEGTADIDAAARITAVDTNVDEATRNVQVQATLANPGGRLRPGMFVEVKVSLETGSPVIAIPASAINYAPYGDSVYIVQEIEGPDGKPYLGVRQQFVKLGGGRGDQISVISGLEPGQEVVTSGVFKLRNGAAVQVNNEILPGNDPAPHPEES